MLTDTGLEILDESDCLQLLRSAAVGRVVIVEGAAAAVFPVNYTMLGSDILFFTATGTKLDAARVGALVTFEADHVDPTTRTGWSVLASGRAALAPEKRSRAESLGLYPWAAGDRHHLVEIRPTFLSGRRLLA